MSIRKGKVGELKIIVELLERGFTVYTPIIDVEGIDCIIKNSNGELIEIQCKYKKKGYFNQFKMTGGARGNYFFIFYYADRKEYWVVPAEIIKEKAHYQESGKWANTYTIDFSSNIQREKFKDYKESWIRLGKEAQKLQDAQ